MLAHHRVQDRAVLSEEPFSDRASSREVVGPASCQGFHALRTRRR